MILEVIKDAILSNVGPLRSAPKNWQKRHCMLCHTQGHNRDTRNRFGLQFNPTSIAVHCFNCGFSAGYTEDKDLSSKFKFFLKQIGIGDDLIKEIEFEIFKNRNNIDSIREGAVVIDKESKMRSLFNKWQPMDLPRDSLSLQDWLDADCDDPDFLEVINYALDRKLEDLSNFYWTPCTDHNLNNRVLIPYKYKGKIVGFTSRLCFEIDGKEIPKYYQQVPVDFVYNLDHQQDWSRKYCLVNEGVLDAWVTDGISTLGEISQPQIDIINRLQKEIILCPDRDKKGWDLVKAAIDNEWAVSFPKWEPSIKDATAATAKYGRLLTTHSIIASAVRGKERIELKWKIEASERERRLR